MVPDTMAPKPTRPWGGAPMMQVQHLTVERESNPRLDTFCGKGNQCFPTVADYLVAHLPSA